MRTGIFYILICCHLAGGCAPEQEIDPPEIPPVGVEFQDLAENLELGEIERFFATQNYRMHDLAGPTPPDPWARSRFGTTSVTEMNFRSEHQVPGWRDTYYRFHVSVETFADPGAARSRLDRLHEHPPATPGSEPDKAFPLRRGFAAGEAIYTLSTDVNGFTPELDRLALDLEKHLMKRRVP